MSRPGLTIGRPVIEELVRLAVVGVPGVSRVGRGGPAWRRWLAARPVRVRIGDDGVAVAVTVVARPSQQLGPLADAVRSAVRAAVERVLALELRSVTVVIDGVGA